MFFFSVWHILSTIQIWNCTYYNTKGKWEEKSIHFCTKRLGKREGIGSFVFFFFLFLGRVGTRARGWQEETKTVYKEPECKGMHISTNFVDFQSLNTTVVFNSEMWNDWLNFIGVPHTTPKRSLHNVCFNDIKKYSTQFWLLNMQDRLEGQLKKQCEAGRKEK